MFVFFCVVFILYVWFAKPLDIGSALWIATTSARFSLAMTGMHTMAIRDRRFDEMYGRMVFAPTRDACNASLLFPSISFISFIFPLMSHPLIDIQHLTWTYPDAKKPLFADFTMKVEQGEFCFLVGKSGAGKTTLVKFLLRQLTPPTKMIFFNKEDIARFSRREVQAYRSRIGVVFQDFKLIDWMTVEENILFPVTIHASPSESYRTHMDHLITMLWLQDRLRAFPPQLSGWERQRAAIARALILSPKLLIADEPTGNIDDESARQIADKFVQLHKEWYTILFITHDSELKSYIEQQTTTRTVQL